MGRFSVELDVTNHEDAILARRGALPPEQVRRARIAGLVKTGASRLVLPATVVTALGLPGPGQVTVRYSDGRRQTRATVGDVEVEIQGRSGVFSAVVEPVCTDAIVGASVLDELDFLVDCTNGTLVAREPNVITVVIG